METKLTRRQVLKLAGIPLVMIPVLSGTHYAHASVNIALRTQLKYQDTPKDEMTCTSCLEFVPGKNERDVGGCKVIPGDNEISPNGYCISWNTM